MKLKGANYVRLMIKRGIKINSLLGGNIWLHIFAHNLLQICYRWELAVCKPSEKESDVKCGAVQIHKLEEEHLQRKAVLPLRFCPWVL